MVYGYRLMIAIMLKFKVFIQKMKQCKIEENKYV